MIEVGDVIPIEVTVRNSAGVPVDASGGVVVTITLPDLTTATPTVQHVALSGVYSVPYTTTVEGFHTYEAVATDPVNGNVFGPESFVVEDPDYVPFVSLAEQLRFMGADDVITAVSDLEELRWFVRVACEAVELDLGRKISPQTVIQRFDGGRCAVILSGPVISITSVVDAGVTLTSADYVVDPAAGILYRGTSTTPRDFTDGRQSVVVTHRAGQLNPAGVARKVARNGALRMWQGSKQMPHPTLDDLDAELQVKAGVLTPLEYAAYQKLKASGIA
jgi:hypothetical protein